MNKIPLASILITDRQRQDLGDLTALAQSLKQHGQIQPILLRKDDNRLVAGGRRCAAALSLGWLDIGFVYRDDLSDAKLAELELEENIRRKDMTWQERCLSIKKIHFLKVFENPLEGKKWGYRETAEMLNIGSFADISIAKRIAQRLESDPSHKSKYWLCESLHEAVKLMLQDQENEAVAILQKREDEKLLTKEEEFLEDLNIRTEDLSVNIETVSMEVVKPSTDAEKESAREKYLSNPHNNPNEFDEYFAQKQTVKEERRIAKVTVPLSKLFFKTDAITFMRERQDTFNHIVTDIPYGIDMDMLDQQNQGMKDIANVAKEHGVEENIQLIKDFFPAAFDSLKDDGFCVTWCDQMLWQLMYDEAIKAGFKVQRWPLTWVKTHSCMNQAAQYNFTKSTEIAMVCRKGKAMLNSFSSTSVVTASNAEAKSEFGGHPFVKPFDCWHFIVDHVSKPGDLILEPFMGRGSGVLSMLKMGRRVIGTELNETHYNFALEKLRTYYKQTIGESETVFT